MVNLSHDVRTPLTTLLGYLDAIHRGVVTGAERDACLETARGKACELKQTVDDLFTWSKLQAGEEPLSLQDCDLAGLTRQQLKDWVPLWEENRLDYDLELPEQRVAVQLDPIGIAEMRVFLRRLCDEQGKTILLSSHILSEIAQLADDVGILDRGRLLEQTGMAALEAKTCRYIELKVPDARQASRLLDSALHIRDFTVLDDRTLRLYDLTLPPDRLNRLLYENGLTILELHQCEDTLEDYFRQITGGEGIGWAASLRIPQAALHPAAAAAGGGRPVAGERHGGAGRLFLGRFGRAAVQPVAVPPPESAVRRDSPLALGSRAGPVF